VIKRMTMLARREDLSREAFRHYWYHNHAHIVRQMPGLARYVQNHVVRELGTTDPTSRYCVDGIPELWFQDERARTKALQSKAAASLPVDERNFLKGITIFAIDERVVRDGQGPIKALFLLGRLGSSITLSREEANDCCTALLGRLPDVRRCVANRVLSRDGRSGVWFEPNPPALIVELRFDTEGDAESALRSLLAEWVTGPATIARFTGAAYLVEERAIVSRR
jgi:uncharacterized protein (TIGR02118 family)